MRKYLTLWCFVVVFVCLPNDAQSQNTTKLINKALKKAKKEDKKVFVNYFSTSCDSSEKMESHMKNDAFKTLLESDYVIVNIVVPEDEVSEYVNYSNPMKVFSGNHSEPMKFPFWKVMDNSGNFVATSVKGDNTNIGYPTTGKDIYRFLEVLRNTSNFSEAKLNLIANLLQDSNQKFAYIN